MAAVAEPRPSLGRDDRGFFLGGAIAMAVTIAVGFSLQLAMGRSSFGAPPIIHAHAIPFMGWVAIYLTQNMLVASGHVALHRRLGWLAAGWVILMVVLGCAVTAFDIRVVRAPFFFRPAQFLVFDPLTLFAFAGLTYAAIALRPRTDWRRRLHFSGMAMMVGPAFGRLLPMPLLAPWAWEATFAACLVFPLAGVASDLRRGGRVIPPGSAAWPSPSGFLSGQRSLPTAPWVRRSTMPSPPARRAPPSHRWSSAAHPARSPIRMANEGKSSDPNHVRAPTVCVGSRPARAVWPARGGIETLDRP
jgi:hypothetical protein